VTFDQREATQIDLMHIAIGTSEHLNISTV